MAGWGGKRPGAGRKPKAKTPDGGSVKRSKTTAPTKGETPQRVEPPVRKDPLAFLEDVVNDPSAPLKDRIRAAVAAAQYRHTKLHDGGKKDAADGAAKKAASGRFAPKAPPKLVVNNQ